MRNKVGHFIHRLKTCRGGNAVLLTAFGLPALLGATGYGVDTAQWYMWKRELQHSVDQAAIAGAWALSYDEDTDTWTTRAEQEYYSNENVNEAYDSAPDVSLTSYSGGTDNSVLVEATVTRSLPFSSMLFNRATTITARAQAAFEEGAKYNACLIALKEDGSTFLVGGSATVIANCGLAALSCSEDSIIIDGSADVETNSIATCGTASVPVENEDAVAENLPEGSLTDAYADLPIPEPDESTPNRVYDCAGKGNNKIATPDWGTYSSIVVKCRTVFTGGVYFIDGGTLDLTANYEVTGIGVMFVLRNGANLKLGGEGNSNGVVLTPMDQASLQDSPWASDADRLAGMLIIEDKTNVDSTVSHVINGNSSTNIEGTLYFPTGDVTINGSSGTTTDLCFQISAYTLKIKGSAYLKTLCDYDDSTEVGNVSAGVLLVG